MGNPFMGTPVGSSAGLGQGENELGYATFLAAAFFPDRSIVLLYILVDLDLVAPGALLTVDDLGVKAYLLRAPMAGAQFELAAWLGGEVEIVEASQTEGAPVELRMTLNLLGGGGGG